jgi:hypothetical protein
MIALKEKTIRPGNRSGSLQSAFDDARYRTGIS